MWKMEQQEDGGRTLYELVREMQRVEAAASEARVSASQA